MPKLQIKPLLLLSLIFITFSEVILIDDNITQNIYSLTALSPPPPPPPKPTPTPTPTPPVDSYMILKSWTRSFDGTGNNDQFTNWGSAGQSQSRFCSNSYTDGLGVMRTDLPNPRDLSNSLGNIALSPGGVLQLSRANWNMLFPLWGQFTQHDISLTKSGSTESVPILVPKCDQWFDKTCTGTQQISFKRSEFDPNKSVRSQINLNTAWLDGSQIYGSSKATADKLRSFSKGKLLTSDGNLLPKDPVSGFFISGDIRVNQNIGLTSLHIIFMRQHNRLCDVILTKNSSLTDEQIYQMARNYVVSLLQKVTFDEYLPSLLGRNQSDAWIGNYTYQNNINPDLYTEFNSAAFRVGHSQINSPYKLIDNNGNILKTLNSGQIFQNPSLLTNESISQIINGLLRVNSKQRGLEMVDDLRNFLTTQAFATFKIDLFSTNVQRGRDHGLCSYKKARIQMDPADSATFEIFNPPNSPNGPNSKANRVQSLYTNLDNVDLWVGIIGERSLPGSDLGDLGGKLVAAQFRKIKNADKLWYENVLAGSPGLLKQIRDTRLGDIIKRNVNVTTVDTRSFIKVV